MWRACASLLLLLGLLALLPRRQQAGLRLSIGATAEQRVEVGQHVGVCANRASAVSTRTAEVEKEDTTVKGHNHSDNIHYESGDVVEERPQKHVGPEEDAEGQDQHRRMKLNVLSFEHRHHVFELRPIHTQHPVAQRV